MTTGWIGVDLDGTLAEYDERHGLERIGRVSVPMLRRVQQWLEQGREVRIITARATDPALRVFVKPWLREHNLPPLEITDSKDCNLLQLWDDRAVQVELNTGRILTPRQFVQLVPNGWLGIELDGTLAQCERPQSLSTIGAPVEAMLNRLKQWQMVGIDARIFTARAEEPGQVQLIREWLQDHGVQPVPVTNRKDFQMSQFFDSQAVHVVHNTGEPSVQEGLSLPEAGLYH